MGSRFAVIVRAITRPIITTIIIAVMAWAVIEGIDLPQWFLGLGIPIIGWWFIERAVTHVQERRLNED